MCERLLAVRGDSPKPLPLKTQGLLFPAETTLILCFSPLCRAQLLHILHRYQLPLLWNRPLLSEAHVQTLEGKEPPPRPHGNLKVFKMLLLYFIYHFDRLFYPTWVGSPFLTVLLAVAFQLYFQVKFVLHWHLKLAFNCFLNWFIRFLFNANVTCETWMLFKKHAVLLQTVVLAYCNSVDSAVASVTM